MLSDQTANVESARFENQRTQCATMSRAVNGDPRRGWPGVAGRVLRRAESLVAPVRLLLTGFTLLPRIGSQPKSDAVLAAAARSVQLSFVECGE